MVGKARLGTVPADIVDVTARGVKRLKVNGHLFRRSKACEHSEYWGCLERGCGMTAVTRGGLVTLLGGVPARGHTHPPASPHQQLVQTLTSNLLRRVRTDLKTPMSAVYQQELDSLMAAVGAVMPSYEMVRSRLYRARQATISNRRRPDPPTAGANGDAAAMSGKRGADGAATYEVTDDIDRVEVTADEGSNPDDVVEIIEVSAEPEDVADSADTCSPADSDEDSTKGDDVSDEAMSDRDAVGAVEHEESALAAVERWHGIGTGVPPRAACDQEEEEWRRPGGSVVRGGAAQTVDLPPVEFTSSARGLPIMQVLQYQFRRWKVTKSTPLVEYWVCTSEGCRSTAVTRSRQLTRLRQWHEHGPPTVARRRAARLSTMRRRARDEATPIPQIYQQERDRAGRPADFPPLGSVRTILYRERQLARRERLAAAAADTEALEAAAAGMAVVVVDQAPAVAAAGQQASTGTPGVQWSWTDYGQPAGLWMSRPV